MSFDGDQRGYYLREINRALPVSGSGAIPSDDTIALALGNVDPMMPGVAGAPATTEARQFLSYYGAGASAYAADAACRQITNPLQMRSDPAARTGCGWYFRKDGSVASTAAYGTRRGPMSPTLDAAGAGTWHWDPMEAALMESQKQAMKIQSCPQIQYSAYPNMGWCPSTNSALATNGFGNPLFPRAPGGDCPGGGIITNASQCPPPGGAAAAGGGTAAAAAGGGDPCATPSANGTLSADCLIQLAQQVGISANSALLQAVKSGDWSTVNSLMQIVGANINWVMTDKNQWQTACQQIAGLANSKPGRAGGAAGAIAFGTAFDPCALQPTDTAPFSADCVTKAALAKGFSPQGAAMPAQWGMDFWNNLTNYNGQSWGDNTWQSVLNQMDDMIKYANTPGYGSPAQQQTAIAQVYGTTIQYPKTDCNNTGILLYRYYFPPTWNWALMPAWGPQTHFLGRYIFKQAVPSTSGDPQPGVIPSAVPSTGSTYKDMAPSGGNLTEAHRLECNFKVTSGDWHIFRVQVDDLCQMYIDDDPNPYLTATCCGNWQAGPPITTWRPNETHKLTWVYVNGGGPWSFGCQLAIVDPVQQVANFGPIPAAQTFMTQDRRKPTLGLEFANPPQLLLSEDFADTNNVLTNWDLEGSSRITQAYGQKCLTVSPSSGLYSYKTYDQGIGSHALRSMTCRLYVDSVTPGTWPSVWEFFNLGGSQPYTNPRQGAPTESFAWDNRRDVTALVINSNGLVCYGVMNQGNNIPWQTTKLNIGLPMKQWCHVAVVYDDDWKGFALYVNAQLADRYRMATPMPNILLEQICIGSVENGDGSGWTGGIAWWRGFDYRLSTDQITLDMNDAWDTLY